MVRRVFYSFHYAADAQRAALIRRMGRVEGNPPATDIDWQRVVGGGDAAIERWIAEQMRGRACLVVLIGTNTADRRWINHEIRRAWAAGMGIVGVDIHGLELPNGQVSPRGASPFDYISCGQKRLSSYVKRYDPPGPTSARRHAWIEKSLAGMVEEAILIRSLRARPSPQVPPMTRAPNTRVLWRPGRADTGF